jgi:hypothetical protein
MSSTGNTLARPRLADRGELGQFVAGDIRMCTSGG